MQGKIAVEEHFRIAETTGSEGRYPGPYWAGLNRPPNGWRHFSSGGAMR